MTADMQPNEIAGHVPPGSRRPHVSKTRIPNRAKRETRAERMSDAESRRPSGRVPAHEPRHYGAGF
jgi:hypothetical protein